MGEKWSDNCGNKDYGGIKLFDDIVYSMLTGGDIIKWII